MGSALLNDFGIHQVEATCVSEENQGAIGLVITAKKNASTKHVNIRHRFIRKNMSEDAVVVKYTSTVDQLVDMLTKMPKEASD